MSTLLVIYPVILRMEIRKNRKKTEVHFVLFKRKRFILLDTDAKKKTTTPIVPDAYSWSVTNFSFLNFFKWCGLDGSFYDFFQTNLNITYLLYFWMRLSFERHWGFPTKVWCHHYDCTAENTDDVGRGGGEGEEGKRREGGRRGREREKERGKADF